MIYKLWCTFELKGHLFGYKKWYLSYNYRTKAAFVTFRGPYSSFIEENR